MKSGLHFFDNSKNNLVGEAHRDREGTYRAKEFKSGAKIQNFYELLFKSNYFLSEMEEITHFIYEQRTIAIDGANQSLGRTQMGT